MIFRSKKVSVSEGEQQFNLYRSLWKARSRRSRFVGTVYLFLSAAFFVLSFLTHYLLAEVVAIISLLLGVALVFVSLEKYAKLSILNETSASLLLSLVDILVILKIQGNGIHIHRDSETLIFIPKDASSSQYVDYKELREPRLDDKGIVIASHGTFLKTLYEIELGVTAEKLDLPTLMSWLPRILVEDLKIAEKVEITNRNDEVLVKFVAPIFSRLCVDKKIVSICKTIGCPVCSSIGDMLAHNTGRAVFHKDCGYSPDRNQLEASYLLGPRLESIEMKDQR